MWQQSAGREVEKVIIIGAGGHGSVIADALMRAHDAGAGATPIGFVDDKHPPGTTILGLPVLGPLASLSDFEHGAIVVAIGENRARHALCDRFLAAGEKLATVVHPATSIAPTARIGEGSMICAGSVVDVRVTIGRSVILNANATVAHDSVVDDFAHVSVGATVGARVRIGTETLIALGASVVSEMRVGARTVIGAGAVVVDHIGDDVIAFGAPARVRS